MKLKSKKSIVTIIAILACLMAFIFVFSMIAGNIKASADDADNGYLTYYSDFSSKEETYEYAYELNQDIAEEAIVMLKNKNNVLPFEDIKNITVFERGLYSVPFNSSGAVGMVGGNAVGFMGRSEGGIVVFDSLREAGYNVNPAMEAFDRDATRSPLSAQTPEKGAGKIIYETAIENYDETLWRSCEAYKDAAVVVLTRFTGEEDDGTLFSAEKLPVYEKNGAYYGTTADQWKDKDGKAIKKLDQAAHIDDHYLQLSMYEADLLAAIQNRGFKNIVVVINSTSCIQPDFLIEGDDGLCDLSYYRPEAKDNSKVDIKAALWIGGLGLDGVKALGKVLKGDITPSGHTADIWSNNFKQDPASINFALNGITDGSRLNFGVDSTTGGSIYTSDYYKNAPAVHQISYAENIYVGYRYYETAAYEIATGGYTVSGYTNDAAGAEKWYNDKVGMPFGFGLSYTEFEWSDVAYTSGTLDAIDAAADRKGNGEINVSVKVTNKGDYAGKDVVQLYYSAPYSDNDIEKSHTVLGNFAKTKLLQPGESQTVKITLRTYDMASYDMQETVNADGSVSFVTDGGRYILEDGAYYLGLCTDSHNVKGGTTVTTMRSDTSSYIIKYDLNNDIIINEDPDTGEDITNRFMDSTEGLVKYGNNNNIKGTGETIVPWMSRADFDGTRPEVTKQKSLTRDIEYTDELYRTIRYTTGDAVVGDKLSSVNSKYDDNADNGGEWTKSEWFMNRAKAGYAELDANGNRVIKRSATATRQGKTIVDGEASSNQVSKILLYELTKYDYNNDAKWDAFLDQLTIQEMMNFVTYGGFGIWGVQELGIPQTRTPDGPETLCFDPYLVMGYAYQCSVACTWNQKLAYEMGRSFGNEALWSRPIDRDVDSGTLRGPISGWYAPDVNMHRSQFGGRNYGYYSEDAILTSKMLVQETQGARDKGLLGFVKHFALNDQETNRTTGGGLITWANEQTMREIYFKGGEATFKGPALGVMSGYNRIGDIWCGNHYRFNQELIRGEWQFKGAQVTDAYRDTMDIDRMIRNGNELPLVGNTFNFSSISDKPTAPGANTKDGKPLYVEKVDANGKLVRNASKEIQYEQATMDFDTQVAALRNSCKYILYAVSQSNGMRNGACLEYMLTGTPSGSKGAITYDYANAGTAYAGKSFTGTAAFTDLYTHNTISYKLYSGSLPSGLSLNAKTGAITGTVSATAAAGTYQFQVEGLVDQWAPKYKAWSITVNALSSTGGDTYVVSGTSANIDASVKGSDAVTYSINGTLPAGMELNTATGAITGTPTDAGKYTFKVVAVSDGFTSLTTEYTIYVLGANGEDGNTPVLTIGEDGYWYIDGIKTDVKAQGAKGDKGDKGDTGDAGGGCNSTIAGTSIAVMLALIGTVLFIVVKRKKTDK